MCQRKTHRQRVKQHIISLIWSVRITWDPLNNYVVVTYHDISRIMFHYMFYIHAQQLQIIRKRRFKTEYSLSHRCTWHSITQGSWQLPIYFQWWSSLRSEKLMICLVFLQTTKPMIQNNSDNPQYVHIFLRSTLVLVVDCISLSLSLWLLASKQANVATYHRNVR